MTNRETVRKYKFRPTLQAYSNIERYNFLDDENDELYLISEQWYKLHIKNIEIGLTKREWIKYRDISKEMNYPILNY